MKISIGSDHGGYQLKEAIKAELLKNTNLSVVDKGTVSEAPVDYPNIAEKVAQDVSAQKSDFGILICTTGIGMSIAANKVKNIRAAAVSNLDAAEFSRKHNNANIICLGSKYHTPYMAKKFIEKFIHTSFDGGRHEQRIQEIKHLEQG